MNSNDTSTNQLIAELSGLRQRMVELEQLVADAQQLETMQHQKTMEYEALLNAIPAMVFLKGRNHRYITVNQMYAESYGLTIDAVVGKTDAELFPPEVAAAYQTNDEEVMASGQPRQNMELPIVRANGSAGWLTEHHTPYRALSGEVIGMVGVAIDVTMRKETEEALQQSEANLREMNHQQEQLIETIRELSTPVMPIHDGIVSLPLVGHIDSTRGEQIMEAVLTSVQRFDAAFIIIDITGVPVIDTAVANHLLRATQAARLLGAQCVLVRISPEVAQTLVQLGVDLRSLITQSTMQAGISYALAQLGRPSPQRQHAPHARAPGSACPAGTDRTGAPQRSLALFRTPCLRKHRPCPLLVMLVQ